MSIPSDDNHGARRELDEDAELQRILEESQRTAEAEANRERGMNDEEQEMFERALRESEATPQVQHVPDFDEDELACAIRESEEASQPAAQQGGFDEDELARALRESEATSQRAPHQGDFDEDELQKILELSAKEAKEGANRPKAFLRQKIRYECGHETDAGLTDIEFDPMAEGLPWLQQDERGKCPDCGGSTSTAPAGMTRAPPTMPVGSNRHGIEEEFDAEGGDAEEDLIDLTAPARPDTPLPEWTTEEDYTGARPGDARAAGDDNSIDETAAPTACSTAPASAHTQTWILPAPVPQPVGVSPTVAPSTGAAIGTAAIDDDHDDSPTSEYSSDEEDDDDEEDDHDENGNPPYATVDNLALEAYTERAEREAAEREARRKVERLRLEGALASRDAGNFDDPVPKRDDE